jgi:hypothetical protein
MTDTFLASAPQGRPWFILDVMRKGDEARPFRRGRPRNDWVALLIDVDPELFRAGRESHPVQDCVLDLGRHKTRDDAWGHAEQLLMARH